MKVCVCVGMFVSWGVCECESVCVCEFSRVHISVYMRDWLCLRVFVCERGRERESEREGGRNREREREKQRERQRKTEREREEDRERERERYVLCTTYNI
jgi:hypothetical protein